MSTFVSWLDGAFMSTLQTQTDLPEMTDLCIITSISAFWQTVRVICVLLALFVLSSTLAWLLFVAAARFHSAVSFVENLTSSSHHTVRSRFHSLSEDAKSGWRGGGGFKSLCQY